MSQYFSTPPVNTNSIAAATTAAVVNSYDTTNANHSRLIGPTLRYLGGVGNGPGYNSQSAYGSQPQQQQLIYNRGGSNGLMSQQNILVDNGTYITPSSGPLTLSTTLGAGCPSYSGVAAASMSSHPYNRNRYMPYSRGTPTTPINTIMPYQQQSVMPRAVSSSLLPVTTIINGNATQRAYSYSSGTYQQCNGNIYASYPSLYGGSGGPTPAPALALTATVTTTNDCGGASKNANGGRHPMGATPPLPLTNDCAMACPNGTDAASTIVTDADGSAVVLTDNNGNALTLNDNCQVCTKSANQAITLQITNLDYTMEEASLRVFLMGQLRPITPVVSLIFEGSSYAKVTVPSMFFAKQVVANLHRKKIGHKRMLVSYTRDSSQTDLNTLRCQVAGLLKDVPYYTLPLYKFRELFQARFKTAISVLDLYKLPDICTITIDNCEEKFISLQTTVISSLENSTLMEGLQHSVPYCTIHFKREQHKGWAEQDIEPLPNVWMTIAEIQKIIYPLLKNHPGDIPVASLVHCISGQMKTEIIPNENGVSLEHLVCCVQGIQIQVNSCGIKILGWLEMDQENYNNSVAAIAAAAASSSFNTSSGGGSTSTATTTTTPNTSTPTSGATLERTMYAKSTWTLSDPLYQISREVIELVKMSPKSTMKFNRFIPAYHNHFGKQCRVADYGYTKLIELFEALATVVQIIGDGENRLITLTHRTQLRRFTSDLLRILRARGNKSVLLSQLPAIFEQTQYRRFDVTDYGVCDIRDILDGLANSNVVVMSPVKNNSDDMLISMPKRKQTTDELEKTIMFAGEMVELFRNAPQYTILFQKFVRSYHYHFAYQCRLSDYGFIKLADLMEAIHGVVEMEQTNDEDKKIYLSPKVARRVFAEQCEELIHDLTGNANTCMKVEEVLQLHKKKFGYQIQARTLGVSSIAKGVELLPYIELTVKEKVQWITCHRGDTVFRNQCYRACKLILTYEANLHAGEVAKDAASNNNNNNTNSDDAKENKKLKNYALNSLIEEFNKKYEEHINESKVRAMKHLIEIFNEKDVSFVRCSEFLKFLLYIVRLIEKRTSIMLAEIRSALHGNIKTTFEFGFPNLFSILSAYSDIFIVNVGPTQERSKISLQPNCELHLDASLNGSAILRSIKPSQRGGEQRPPRPTRAPLSENNNIRNCSTQGPPAKMRALSKSNNENPNPQVSQQYYKGRIPSATFPTSQRYATPQQPKSQPMPQQPQQTSTHQQQLQQQQYQLQQQQQQQFVQMHANLSNDGGHNSSSIYSMASHNSTLNTSASSSMCANENSFNSSFGSSLNNSLNSSSNLSISELNVSRSHLKYAELPLSQSTIHHPSIQMCQMTGSVANGKLWDRRYATAAPLPVISMVCHQQQQQAMMVENVPGHAALIMSTSEAAEMQHHHQRSQFFHASAMEIPMLVDPKKIKQESGVTNEQTNLHMYPMFEPPKPDTPPSNDMPYWIDPIWSQNNCESETTKNAALNIKLPELKSLNVLPMVLSPYTLSKTENLKQKVFNFDNHDRKIA